MNPRTLIDQNTGRPIAAQVMRAAHRRAAFLASIGKPYRELFALSLRNAWALALNEAHIWTLEHSTGSGPMLYTGGRVADGVMNEGRA